jgi:hypothetical protein
MHNSVFSGQVQVSQEEGPAESALQTLRYCVRGIKSNRRVYTV